MDRIAKSLIVAFLLVIGLAAGAALTSLAKREPRPPAAVDLSDIEGRIGAIEERLARLDALEERVERLAAPSGEPAAPPAAGKEPAPDVEASPEAGTAEAPARAEDPAERRARAVASAIRAAGGDEGLRGYIARVVDEQREARTAEARRAIEERQREFAALQEGPWGKFNYKVNTLARRLNLTEPQKQLLFAQLTNFNARLDALREEEKADPENAQRYRDARKDVRKEFTTLFMGGLTPPQAETFKAMPEGEQRPDGATADVRVFVTGDAAEGASIPLPSIPFPEGTVQIFGGGASGGGAVGVGVGNVKFETIIEAGEKAAEKKED